VKPVPTSAADTEAPAHIFPTSHRDKHAKTLSFPLGAEALTRALDGVPQHGMLTCSFYAGSPHRDPQDDAHFLLQVTYRRRARSFNDGGDAAERGVLDPRWAITVFAVPQGLRHLAKTLLLEQGLPALARPWLIKHAGLTGQTGGAGLVLKLDVFDKTLISAETHNILPQPAGR
jgi:hypothetical protein